MLSISYSTITSVHSSDHRRADWDVIARLRQALILGASSWAAADGELADPPQPAARKRKKTLKKNQIFNSGT